MTDKVNVQIPAPRSGVVSRILVKEDETVNVKVPAPPGGEVTGIVPRQGETVNVGQKILIISEEGEKEPELTPPPPLTPPGETTSAQRRAPPTYLSESPGARVLATPATRR